MNFHSVFWAIALSLFLGALGLPIPENPILIGGGYAVFEKLSPAMPSIITWYLAILFGDAILFGTSYWFFTRRRVARILKRYVGPRRFDAYQKAFSSRGGWTLFLARFTFGIRAAAYIAAGAAHYPWKRFLLADSLSVAIQVVMFVGIGYYAGERIDWANNTGEKIVVFLGIIALVTIIITWLSSSLVKRMSAQNGGEPSK
jgi:undecaprenyl-diphosphatase